MSKQSKLMTPDVFMELLVDKDEQPWPNSQKVYDTYAQLYAEFLKQAKCLSKVLTDNLLMKNQLAEKDALIERAKNMLYTYANDNPMIDEWLADAAPQK